MTNIQELRKSNEDVSDLNRNIGRAFQQVSESSSELAASQTHQAAMNRELALKLQDSLKSIQGQEINAIMGAFSQIHNQLVSLTTSPEL